MGLAEECGGGGTYIAATTLTLDFYQSTSYSFRTALNQYDDSPAIYDQTSQVPDIALLLVFMKKISSVILLCPAVVQILPELPTG
ncbi:hypothetical protein GCM10022212_29870 [Actimicrobium antarcticum]|uniref:Uncharacterized protein n=1 Tax=Actimicrobium antarcticum TaxID=1051899 RepID=A0ABP7TR09_9BURK